MIGALELYQLMYILRNNVDLLHISKLVCCSTQTVLEEYAPF